MITQVKQMLLLLLLVTAGRQAHAQTIDSFHVNSTVTPHELFVRLHFPDSNCYVQRTFDRVALIYPPVNVVTFFYRSCDFVTTNPVRDTVIPIYTPEPYGLRLWLVRDSNTIIPECAFAGATQTVMDSASYDWRHTGTGIVNPDLSNNTLQLFPNPAAGVLHVAGIPGCELQISDGLGKLLVRQKLQNMQETVDISRLSPGQYYIHCYRDGLRLQSHCFTKLP